MVLKNMDVSLTGNQEQDVIVGLVILSAAVILTFPSLTADRELPPEEDSAVSSVFALVAKHSVIHELNTLYNDKAGQ